MVEESLVGQVVELVQNKADPLLQQQVAGHIGGKKNEQTTGTSVLKNHLPRIVHDSQSTGYNE
jgi:hypothetical protein